MRYEPYSSARNMWRYTQMKNAEAPVECRYRISQPHGTSRMMYSTEANASVASGL